MINSRLDPDLLIYRDINNDVDSQLELGSKPASSWTWPHRYHGSLWENTRNPFARCTEVGEKMVPLLVYEMLRRQTYRIIHCENKSISSGMVEVDQCEPKDKFNALPYSYPHSIFSSLLKDLHGRWSSELDRAEASLLILIVLEVAGIPRNRWFASGKFVPQ